MTKTRVLLAFGRHGNSGRGMGPMLGNARFFQKAAHDFLRGSDKGAITIIHEQGPELGMTSASQISRLMDVWSALKAFRSFVSAKEMAIADITPKRAYAEAMMNMGARKEVLGTDEIDSRNDPFGMFAFARTRPERARILVETQSGEAYYLGLLYAILDKALSLRRYEHMGKWSEEDVEIMTNLLRVFAELNVHRDKNVVRQIDTMADDRPGGSFIVPRGFGHRHMTKILDGERFDIELKEEDGVCLGFDDDMLSLSYSGSLEEAEVRRYAALNLDYNMEMERGWRDFIGDVRTILERQEIEEVSAILEREEIIHPWSDTEEKISAALNAISMKARKSALEKESKRK